MNEMENTCVLPPSQADIDQLRQEFESAKRQAEYEKLKQELANVTHQAINTPNEFEGAMQLPDTDKVLQSKRSFRTFFELLIARSIKMLSPRPVIGNLIAIGLVLFALTFLHHEMVLKNAGEYQHYIDTGLLIFAGLQILKSSTRSLLLPIIAMVLGAIISQSLPHGDTLFSYGVNFYQYLMIAGVIGVGISVLTID